MRDSHVVIVNDVRQVIGRTTIRLDENRVFKAELWTCLCSFFTFPLTNDSVNKIGVHGWGLRKLQSNDMFFTSGSTFLRLSSWDADASSIIIAA